MVTQDRAHASLPQFRASRSDWLLAVLLTISQFTFLLAVRPIAGIGIWFQSEPVSGANTALAALVAALVATRVSRSMRLPITAAALLGLAGWSVITLPFALAPVGSWLGTPQSGNGIGWLLTAAAFAAGAGNLRCRRGPLFLVAVGSVGAAILIVALNRWAPMEWRPQHFMELGAYNALFAWAVVMALRPNRTVAIATTLGLFVLLAFCSNRTALIAILAGAGAMALTAWIRHWPSGRTAATLLPVLAALGVTTGVIGLGNYTLLREVPHSLRDTVVSRANMVRVVGVEIAQNPAILVTGLGWGSFDVALARSMALDGVALQPHAANEFLFWDAAHRNDFHTHNEMVEATLAAGLPAGMGWIAVLGLAVHQAPRHRRAAAAAFAVALAVLGSMWFQLPTSVPAFGLALGLVACPWRPRPTTWRPRLVLSLTTVLLVATSAALWGRAMEGRREFAVSPPPCSPVMGGFARIHAVWLIQAQWHRLLDAMQDPIEPGTVAVEAERLRGYLCAAEAMATERDGTPFAVEASIIRSDLLVAAWPAEAESLRAELVGGLGTALVRTLALAPRRGDLAAPYLGTLLAQGREQELLEFVRHHLATNDPVGLWYSGSVMIGRAETFEQGVRRLRAALTLGVERFVMIPPELKTQIRATGG